MIPIHLDTGTGPARPQHQPNRLANLDQFLVEDKTTGDYRLHRSAFTDEALFELEMKHIFEGNWIYLAHESQIPNNNDYYTTIGRQPVVIARKPGRAERVHQRLQPPRRHAVPAQARQQGQLHLPVPRLDLQQQRQAAEGQGPEQAGYPECFNKDGSHDLKKLARFRTIAASCSAASTPTCRRSSTWAKPRDHRHDRRPVAGWPGSAARLVDLHFDGNWKLQAENGADGYHVSAVHWNYAATTSHRKQRRTRGQDPP
jgi:benzoate/toluate 1,2-dioxygenase alpha subunit